MQTLLHALCGNPGKEITSPGRFFANHRVMAECLDCSPDGIRAILNRTAATQDFDLFNAKNIDCIKILIGSVTRGGIAEPDTVNQQEGLVSRQSPQKRGTSAMISLLNKYPGGKPECCGVLFGRNF